MTALNVVWLRNDLRTYDNAALTSAVDYATRNGSLLLVLFVATPDTWRQHHMAAIKQDLIRRRVLQLRSELAQLNIPLLALEGSNYASVAQLFARLAQRYCLNVFLQSEYELREVQRDAQVERVVSANNGQLIRFDSQCIMAPGSVLTAQGGVFKVFTPFKRSWLARLQQEGVHCVHKPKALAAAGFNVDALLSDLAPHFNVMQSGDDSSAPWPVSEQVVLERLRQFCREHVEQYAKARDFPILDGTSLLSPYLAIGVLSARQCVARLQLEQATELFSEGSGSAIWLSELIWRDFYKHILVAYPELIKHQPFQADTRMIRWGNNPDWFAAWCEGRTGYPIVDAAMRQLNQTGWMHNRLRMITASFLVKDLQIDWRWGEQYFMSKLIDGDFAANNGGWQWAASTGTDAAPYFRIFNPVTQSEKFDPSGDFIRKFVPELADLDGKSIHWPHSKAKRYIAPIVEHAKAREITLALFKQAKQQHE